MASVRGRRLVVLELGAGTAIATIRRVGERLAAERDRVTLVRINPDATEADAPAIPIRMGAREALTRIEAALPASFRDRCRAQLPERSAMSGVEARRRIKEFFKKNPGAIASTNPVDDLKNIKFRKTYSKAWKIEMPSGYVAWVDQIDVQRNYLGMITGLAGTPYVEGAIERAKQFAQQNFGGPAPLVIPPKLFDATSDYAVLPPLRFVAQICSGERITDQDDGSWMNLIWFAEIDDNKSIKAFVEEALAQVDWKKQAEGYEI